MKNMINQYSARFYDPWDLYDQGEIVLFSARSDHEAQQIIDRLCSERHTRCLDTAHTWGTLPLAA